MVTTSPSASGERVEALDEHDLCAARQRLVIHIGVQAHPHLATTGEHVDRAVVVLADDDAVRGRWLAELVDLVAQRGDVLAGLAQRVRELLVLRDGVRELALGLQQPLLEGTLPLGRLGQLAPQLGDLFVHDRHLGLQHRLVLGVVLGVVPGFLVVQVDVAVTHVTNLTPVASRSADTAAKLCDVGYRCVCSVRLT
jgi:hypothetical protein